MRTIDPELTIDLSQHAASGTWDTQGDNIPPYGGIRKALEPLLPLFDHLITTLNGRAGSCSESASMFIPLLDTGSDRS